MGRRVASYCSLLLLPLLVMADAKPVETLDALHARIESGELPGVHAVIVRRAGQTLAEWYFPGRDQTILKDLGHIEFTPQTLHDVRSVTKSVVALLFGIAMEEGLISSLDTPVVAYFPEYTDLPGATTADVTLRHVLSMTSGWNWDEFTYPYTDPRNSEIAMELADDPIRHVFTQPRVSPPGEQFHYSGGDVALIGAVIAKTAGKPLDQYAVEKLFAPLGITRHGWSKRVDVPRAASGLRLTPPDMMKIAELVVARGAWNGRQVVPAAWIGSMTSKHIAIPAGRAPGSAYGYFWWLGRTDGVDWIGAFGNGGQRIWIVPSLDLLVVTTMGLYDNPDQARVPPIILQAAIEASRPPPPL